MKRITALLLMATLLFSVASCAPSGSGSVSETTDSSSDPQPEATEISIDNSFAVVYSASANGSEKAAAETVVNALARLGITVSLQEDSLVGKSNEILIGRTNRKESPDALNGIGEGDFAITLTGSRNDGYKIVLAASSEDGIELAAKYFSHTYLCSASANRLPLALSFTHTRTNVKLAGTPISEYTVVYAKEGVGGDKNIQAAKYADTAAAFVELIKKATGVEIHAVPDTEDMSKYSRLILFGNTGHIEDNKMYTARFVASGINAYAAKILDNGNVALAGNNACSALSAGEALVCAMLGEDGEVTALNKSGTKDLIHVACVGDSITYGTNSTDPSVQSYPVYLQRMLGYDYYVEKYGAPSHSLIETDTPSFLKHDYFKKSVAAKPDVVIVMLGTNDCRTQRWEDSAYKDWSDPSRKEAFLASGQKLVDAYRNANKEVQIIFTTCPTVPQDAWLGTDWTFRIVRYGNPSIVALAEKNNCPVIDVYSYSTKHPEMFEGGDGLHPQNQQYEILAQGIYELSKDIIKK